MKRLNGSGRGWEGVRRVELAIGVLRVHLVVSLADISAYRARYFTFDTTHTYIGSAELQLLLSSRLTLSRIEAVLESSR
jgi:hypothetical protein